MGIECSEITKARGRRNLVTGLNWIERRLYRTDIGSLIAYRDLHDRGAALRSVLRRSVTKRVNPLESDRWRVDEAAVRIE